MTWFVLLIQDGSPVVTEAPGEECFATEDEAIAFAVESAKQDRDGGDGAIYHVMSTVRTVQAKRRITIKIVDAKGRR